VTPVEASAAIESSVRFWSTVLAFAGTPALLYFAFTRGRGIPRGGPTRLPHGAWVVLACAGAWIGALVVGGVALVALHLMENLPATLALTGIANLAGVGAGLLVAGILRARASAPASAEPTDPTATARDTGFVAAPAPSSGAFGFLAAAAFFPVAFAVSVATQWALTAMGLPAEGQRVVLEALANPSTRWFVVAFAVLVAPVTEEWFFRGFLFPALRNRMGFAAAALLSSAAFGVVHVEIVEAGPNLYAVPATTLLGLAACALRERTGGMIAPIVFHTAYNGIAMAVVLIAT
jgi:membrane protease YdiL (CAAX protease family)